MKESFARIVAWSKAHPWLAALILGAVILLGYFVYKRSQAGGATGAGEASAPPAEGMDQSSPIPDMSSFGSPVTSGGLSSVPSNDVGISSMTGAQAIKPMTSSIPVFSASDLAGGVGWTPPGIDESVASLVSQPAAAKTPTVTRASEYVAPGALSRAEMLGFPSGNTSAKVSTTKQPTTSLNPAQKLGKGKNFTGWIGSTYYEKGYPKSTASYKPVFTPQFTPQSPAAKPGAIIPTGQTPSTLKGGSLTSYFGGSV